MVALSAPIRAARVAPARRLAAPPSFPHFKSTAGDQLDPKLGDRFAGLRVRLRNAFTPSQPVTDRRLFAGRAKTMSDLIRSIEDERLHTVIYGERGIGKTSMLHVLAQAARDARYQVVYVSCGAESNFDEMIRSVARGIPLLFHGEYGPTSPEAEKHASLANLLTAEPISVRTASDLLHTVTGTRVLVILDEFDRCESRDFRRCVGELLKSLSDRSSRVQLVIAGVAANLTELVENVPSVQRNVYALNVPKMTATEIRQLVTNGEEVSGVLFDDAATQAIISRAIGFPYLASLLGHRAGLLAIDDGRTTVTADDVAVATSEAVAELKGRISKRSQMQISDCVQAGMLGTLGAVAGAAQSSGGQFTSDDIGALRGDAESIAKAKTLIDHLATAGALIERQEDEFGHSYRFVEDSVPIYLWLLSAQHRFAETSETAPAPVAAER
ncbi:MAG: AAA family ATPase [Caulobacteraceae bacterium]